MRTTLALTALLTPTAYAVLQRDGFDPLNKQFDKKVEALLDVLHIPGMSIAVVQGDMVASKGYGFQQLPDVPATADTLYYTGSTSKAFVAAAAGMVVQNQIHFPDLKWSASMAELLAPDFALSKEYESYHTTLEDALSHRSGLPRHDFAYGWGNATITETIRRMRYLPLTAEPRTRWQYCNLMFGAVGAMIEKHTGSSLEYVLRTWIWEPLGMRSTTFVPRSDAAKEHLARGYFWHKDGYYIPEQYYDITPLAGAGAIISNVNDYALWIKALLNAAGPSFVNKTNPITTKLFTEVTAPRIVLPNEVRSSGAPITYALGWILARVGPYNVITHSGGLPGFATEVFLVPELRLGFVSVANTASEESAPAGTILFLEVLKRMGKMDAEVESLEVDGLMGVKKEMMLPGNIRHAGRGPGMFHQDAGRQSQGTKSESRPLPGDVYDYVGLFSHPAYGILNITFLLDKEATLPSVSPRQRPLSPASTSNKTMILATPSPRLWSDAFALWHNTFSTFDVQALMLHGSEKDVEGCNGTSRAAKSSGGGRILECRNEAAIEVVFVSKAIFEYGLDGEVEWLGIEVEPEMVRDAKESPNRQGWKKGMIWFEKIG